MLTRWIWPHRSRTDCLRPEHLQSLRLAVLQSPYLAATDLNEGFTGTHGFTLLFQRSERARAEALIPELGSFFDQAMKPQANVFFLNPLVMHAGSGVAPHADKTLVSYVETGQPPFPFCVSVLYLNVPKQKTGGQLVFHRGIAKLKKTPQENLLIEFPGWLLHEVTPLKSEPGTPPRVSLVLEQYQVGDEMLSQVPRWSLETSRPFSDFMDLGQDAAEGLEDESEEGPEA